MNRASKPSVAAAEPWWEWIWPSLTTTASARYAVKHGYWAAIVSAVGVAGVVAVNTFARHSDAGLPFGVGALLDAAAFAAIAIGLSRQSVFAAVSGLTLYVIELAYAWSQSRPFSPAVVLMFVLAFTNAVRGALALRRPAVRQGSQRPT